MAYVDENGVMHPTLVESVFNPTVIVPLVFLIAIFFAIMYYSKNRKYLIIYSIIALIFYIVYLYIFGFRM